MKKIALFGFVVPFALCCLLLTGRTMLFGGSYKIVTIMRQGSGLVEIEGCTTTESTHQVRKETLRCMVTALPEKGRGRLSVSVGTKTVHGEIRMYQDLPDQHVRKFIFLPDGTDDKYAASTFDLAESYRDGSCKNTDTGMSCEFNFGPKGWRVGVDPTPKGWVDVVPPPPSPHASNRTI